MKNKIIWNNIKTKYRLNNIPGKFYAMSFEKEIFRRFGKKVQYSVNVMKLV